MSELQGKVAIITGAAGSIGFACAKLFVARGAKVLLVDVDVARVDAAAASLESPSARGFATDLSKAGAAEAMVRAATEAFGGVDVLHANAGIEGAVGPILQSTDEAFERVFVVNVLGVVRAMRAAVPVMAARGGGSVVVTGSVASLVGSAGLAPYVASKHAAFGVVKTAALEFAPLKVRVNAIAPGPIDNRMMRSIEDQAAPGRGDAVKADFTTRIPMGRYGTNEEIAEMAAFLASDRSRYSTGAIFVADGGFVAQ